MSEIKKMYSNAGIRQVCDTCELRGYKRLCPTKELCVRTNPPFTAEKQLELIKLIANRKGYPDYEYFGNLFNDYVQLLDFDEAIAALVNLIWLGLTEQERTKIKKILE